MIPLSDRVTQSYSDWPYSCMNVWADMCSLLCWTLNLLHFTVLSFSPSTSAPSINPYVATLAQCDCELAQ